MRISVKIFFTLTAIIVAVSVFIPITIEVGYSRIIIGSDDFSVLNLLRNLFFHTVLTITSYTIFLLFFKFVIRKNVFYLFSNNKVLYFISMHIVFINSFIISLFSLGLSTFNHGYNFNFLNFIGYSLVYYFVIKGGNLTFFNRIFS